MANIMILLDRAAKSLPYRGGSLQWRKKSILSDQYMEKQINKPAIYRIGIVAEYIMIMQNIAITYAYRFSIMKADPVYWSSYSSWIKCLVFFISQEQPLSQHLEQPFIDQNPKLTHGAIVLKKQVTAMKTPTAPYQSAQKSSNQPERIGPSSGIASNIFDVSLTLELIMSKRSAVLMN